jgi:hypothetical protein
MFCGWRVGRRNMSPFYGDHDDGQWRTHHLVCFGYRKMWQPRSLKLGFGHVKAMCPH